MCSESSAGVLRQLHGSATIACESFLLRSCSYLNARRSLNKHVAVKILMSNMSKRTAGFDELAMMKVVNSLLPVEPHLQSVCKMLDDFALVGPNGHHTCLVYDVLGPSVDTLTGCYSTGILPLDVSKGIARDVLKSLDFLHSQCRIIHAGAFSHHAYVWTRDVTARRQAGQHDAMVSAYG